jgi:hypothetical protein
MWMPMWMMTMAMLLLAAAPAAAEPIKTQDQAALAKPPIDEARRRREGKQLAATVGVLGHQLAVAKMASNCGTAPVHRGARVFATQIDARLEPMRIHPEVVAAVRGAERRLRGSMRGMSGARRCVTVVNMANDLRLEQMAPPGRR